jgi:subtilisin family serine protease
MIRKLTSTALIAVIAITAMQGVNIAASSAIEHTFSVMETQGGAPWPLDRIDGTKDGSYTYGSSGEAVRIYIVDTGVDASHPDFGGRVADGFDSFGENLDQVDCHGHGTHVAGIAAGTYFGVAKKATIVPIRVLNCSGQGKTSTLTAGIDWILANHAGGSLGIVNMSLGGPKDDAVNAATSRLVSAGLVVVSAAGNSNVDACTSSPASAPGVIAVGSVDNADIKSPFSNWGTCVDIFAPGSRIASNTPSNHSASVQKSGTSQASPFVSGIIATYISSGSVATATSAEAMLHALSDKSAVVGGKSVHNDIAMVSRAIAGVPVATPSVPVLDRSSVSQDVFIMNVTARSVSLAWTPKDNVNYYSVKIGRRGQAGYIYTANTSYTEIRVDNLYSNTDYVVKVVPYGRGGVKLSEGTSTSFYAPYGLPSAPQNFKIKNYTLTWGAPSYNGGATIPSYIVQVLGSGGWVNLGETTNTYYAIVQPGGGSLDTYRVVSKTSAGLGAPTNELSIVGTGIPNGFEPVPNLPTELQGTVVASQRRAGSGAVNVSWSVMAGAIGYDIYTAPLGTDLWNMAGSVSSSATSRVIAIRLGQDIMVKVVAKTSSGTTKDLGTVQYRGN